MEEDTCEHGHCFVCFKINCKKWPSNDSCSLVVCSAKCGAIFHSCKETEHKLICRLEKVACINYENGCPVTMTRSELASHLERCPASVVYCTMEWNRWPLYSKERQIRIPFAQNNTHARYGQLDVALAMRDQRVLNESMKAPRRTRRVLQNTLTRKYPAVPLQTTHATYYAESDAGVASNDTSRTVSEDESDAPWEQAKSPPGLQRSICSKLYRATMQTTESLAAAIDTAINATADEDSCDQNVLADIPENVTCRKSPNSSCDNSRNGDDPEINGATCENGGKNRNFQDSVVRDDDLTVNHDENCVDIDKERSIRHKEFLEVGRNVSDEEFAIPKKFTTDLKPDDQNVAVTKNDAAIPKAPDIEMVLNELLGLDLYIESITRYQAKPCSMYTFLCAQQFRRDEYTWHFKNVHCDIHSGMNGWLEQRCPLAQYGCTYSFRRFFPPPTASTVVYSQTLESFGIKSSSDIRKSTFLNGYCDDNCRSPLPPPLSAPVCRSPPPHLSQSPPPVSRSRSRSKESTPEIYTSYNYSSSVCLQRRNKSPVKTRLISPPREATLTVLPFEVLRHLTRYLDGFSLNNLAMTNHLLRDVCCSVLEDRGIVIPHWERAESSSGGVKWKIAFKRWFFSTVFTPVREWKFTDYQPIGEHLKRCVFNKRLIRTRPYLFPMTGELAPDVIDRLFNQAEEMQNSSHETQCASLNFGDDTVD